jgi:hypothetical protein
MTPHPITLYSLDGEILKGEYTFTRRMKGNVKVARPDTGEVLTGEFTSVDERTFAYSYNQAFGRAFGTVFGPAGTAMGSAQASASGYSWGVSDSGRFQGMGFLHGQTIVMQCFYVGSTRTNNGIGKCKSSQGKEYDLQF